MAKKTKKKQSLSASELSLITLVWILALWPFIQWGIVLDPFTYTHLGLNDPTFNLEHIFKIITIILVVILIMGWIFYMIDFFCKHSKKKV